VQFANALRCTARVLRRFLCVCKPQTETHFASGKYLILRLLCTTQRLNELFDVAQEARCLPSPYPMSAAAAALGSPHPFSPAALSSPNSHPFAVSDEKQYAVAPALAVRLAAAAAVSAAAAVAGPDPSDWLTARVPITSQTLLWHTQLIDLLTLMVRSAVFVRLFALLH
jgi:hypothetical protein